MNFVSCQYLNKGKSCCCSVAELCPTLCNPRDCNTPGFPVLHFSWSLLKLTSIQSVMLFNCLIFCLPLLLLPSIFPSIRVFSSELALLIRWPKYWSFSFNISPSNEYSGLIFFRVDLFDLLAVQGTLKSLLQHHSLKASILWCSAEKETHSSILAWRVGLYSPWGHKELDKTEQFSLSLSQPSLWSNSHIYT